MKKTFVKSIVLLVVICIFSSFFCISINAANGTYISFSSNTVNKGKNVTVTVTFKTNKAMSAVEGIVGYDSSVLKFVSGTNANCSGGGGKIVIACNGNSASATLTFKAIGVGNSSFSVRDCVYVPTTNNNSVSIEGASATLTVIDKSAQSNDASLKSLSISNGSLSPSFSKTVYSYSVNVENSIKSLRISAVTNNNKASVKISGSDTLSVGNNTRVITVTAENGTVKKYTVTINRKAEEKQESSSSEVSSTSSNSKKSKIEIDGSKFYLSENIEKVKKPAGFELEEYTYNSEKTPCYKAKKSNYVIFYAVSVNGKESKPCLYNTELNTFTFYLSEKIGGKQYIIPNISNAFSLPELEGYNQELLQIHNKDIYAYKSNMSEQEDFLFLYAVNSSGEYNFYRYDSEEDTIQRYIELEDTEPAVNQTELTNVKEVSLPFGLSLITVLFGVSGLLVVVGIVLAIALVVVKNRNKE